MEQGPKQRIIEVIKQLNQDGDLENVKKLTADLVEKFGGGDNNV